MLAPIVTDGSSWPNFYEFINEMFSTAEESEEMVRLAGAFKARLSDCMERTDDGSLKMTISLPDEAFLDNMARSLAQMVSAGRPN